MKRKLSMLYGAILIKHFKPFDPISHIYHLSPPARLLAAKKCCNPNNSGLRESGLIFLEESSQMAGPLQS